MHPLSKQMKQALFCTALLLFSLPSDARLKLRSVGGIYFPGPCHWDRAQRPSAQGQLLHLSAFWVRHCKFPANSPATNHAGSGFTPPSLPGAVWNLFKKSRRGENKTVASSPCCNEPNLKAKVLLHPRFPFAPEPVSCTLQSSLPFPQSSVGDILIYRRIKESLFTR